MFIHGGLWAALVVLIWSGSLVLLRLGVTTHLNVCDLTALRFGTAAMVLFPFIIKYGFAVEKIDVIGLLLMIGGFGALYTILISHALETALASAAGALNPGIMAVSSVLMSVLIFRDNMGVFRLIGIVLILVGALILVFQQSIGFNKGHLFLILTGIMWAGYMPMETLMEISACKTNCRE